MTLKNDFKKLDDEMQWWYVGVIAICGFFMSYFAVVSTKCEDQVKVKVVRKTKKF